MKKAILAILMMIMGGVMGVSPVLAVPSSPGGENTPNSATNSGNSNSAANSGNNNSTGSGNADSNCVQSSFFDNTGDGRYCDDEKGGGIFMILGIVLDVLTYGVGILAVVGFVMVGIMYTTARDNEGQVAKAKERLGQIVIGLVIYALLYALLQFLIPGGVF